MSITISQLDPAGTINGSEQFEVSQLSASVAVSGTGLSVDATAGTIADSAAGFVTAGFAAGDRVSIEGFSNSGNNLFSTYLITVTAGLITLGLGVDDVLVTEGAGSSVTITKWTSGRVSLSGATETEQLLLPSAFYPGVPADAAVLLYVPLLTATVFPADFAGSVCKSLVAATAITVIDIQRNGSDVGTITFQAASNVGVFSSTGAEVVFAAGDMLSFVNQATADATLASIGTSLYGVR